MQIDDIVNKVFSRSFMGYDMREVDSFLDDVIDKLERYESERREMLTAMEYLLDKLEKGGTLPESRKSLPAADTAGGKHSRGPRLIRAAKKEKKAAAEVAVELELDAEAPDMDELFPEILETLAELEIPPDGGDADQRDRS